MYTCIHLDTVCMCIRGHNITQLYDVLWVQNKVERSRGVHHCDHRPIPQRKSPTPLVDLAGPLSPPKDVRVATEPQAKTAGEAEANCK